MDFPSADDQDGMDPKYQNLHPTHEEVQICNKE